MKSFACSSGTTLSYATDGSGPPLVLVHGSFSDHVSNWSQIVPLLEGQFTLHAVARYGRGVTRAAPVRWTLEEEAADVAELIRALGAPVYLVGHSYGAQVALKAASLARDAVDRLVLYEPPWPHTTPPETLQRLKLDADAGRWEAFAEAFFGEVLGVDGEEFRGLKSSDAWHPIVEDAPASWRDIQAMCSYGFEPAAFADLAMPVLLQVGEMTPREMFATDALAAVLADAKVEMLAGQGHEAMSTEPELYAASLRSFLI